MFGSSYWYVGPAPDGRRFCWAKTPTFECPVNTMATDARRKDGGVFDQILVAASSLGVSPQWLAMRIAGSSHGRAREPGESGKLTMRCLCGAKMDRLGFAYWSETPDENEDAVATRLGLGHRHTRGETRYADTKREAEQWARDELKIAKVA